MSHSIFIAATTEIRDTLDKIDRELMNFWSYLEWLFRLFYNLLSKKSKFRKRLYGTEQMFKEDLTGQFAKVIITNGKYSSGIFTGLEGNFLERMYG